MRIRFNSIFAINFIILLGSIPLILSAGHNGFLLWSFRRQFLTLAFSVLGVSFEMLGGMPDLAFSAEIAAATCIGAVFMKNGAPIPFALLMMFLMLLLSGSIKALLVSYVRINPLITTFALSYIISGIGTAVLDDGVISINSMRLYFYSGVWDLLFILFFLCLGFSCLVMTKTYLGRYVRMLGEDESVLRQSGMSIFRIRLLINSIAAVFYLISAIIYLLITSSGSMYNGINSTYRILGAVFLSGIGFMTGKGNLLFCFLGTSVIVALEIIATEFRLPYYCINLLMGIIIILCCMGDIHKNRR